MTLKEKLQQDLLFCMKNAEMFNDEQNILLIRSLLTEITKEEKKKNTSLNEEQELKILLKEKKELEETLEYGEKFQRYELIENSRVRLQLLQQNYLPAPLTEQDIKLFISEFMQNLALTSQKDFGKLMKELSPKIKGKFDGKRASEIVKEMLGV